MNNTPKRLESLDALRGFDLFLLVGLEAVMHALDGAIDAPWFDRLSGASPTSTGRDSLRGIS